MNDSNPKEEATAVEQRDFLLAASAWQESLLQSYRGLHANIQGFLIAASSTVLAVQLTGAVQEQSGRPIAVALFNLGFTTLLAVLLWFQTKTASELRKVAASRSLDINHWHKATILAENRLRPEQRAFTYFKMWQHAHRAHVAHVLPEYLAESGISEAKADELIGKGLGHTRSVVDVNLFSRLHRLCVGVLACSALITVWFVYVWLRAAP